MAKEFCKRCDLSMDANILWGEGSINSPITIIGNHPNYYDNKYQKLYTREAGSLLDSYLKIAGIKRRDCFITNVVKCKPYHNEKVTAINIRACRPHLISDLSKTKSKIIILLGSLAVNSFFKKKSIKELRFKWTKIKDVHILVTYDMSYLVYNQDDGQHCSKDWLMVKEKLNELYPYFYITKNYN